MYEFFKSLVSNIDINIIDKNINGRKIIIWGAGEGGKIVSDILLKNNINIYGVIDKNRNNIKKFFQKVKEFVPDDLISIRVV